jgi:hypothetical protein
MDDDAAEQLLAYARGAAAAEHERARRRLALDWARPYAAGTKLPALDHVPQALSDLPIERQAGPQPHTVLALLGHVRVGVERASLAGEEARRAEREAEAPALHVA